MSLTKWVISDSSNGLLPAQHQTIVGIIAGILSVGILEIEFR